MLHKDNETDTIHLKSGEGRTYHCSTMTAVLRQTKMKPPKNTAFRNGGLNQTQKGQVLINTKTMTKFSTDLKAQLLSLLEISG